MELPVFLFAPSYALSFLPKSACLDVIISCLIRRWFYLLKIRGLKVSHSLHAGFGHPGFWAGEGKLENRFHAPEK